jgi:ubiquinone/menaquinone biosynthesis C-methylase UbiE
MTLHSPSLASAQLDLEDVVCPNCRVALHQHSEYLRCASCAATYPQVVPGVPSLLPASMDALKQEILRHWHEHNMDVDWRRPHPEFEKGTWTYFRETDRRWFNWHRPFLHSTYPLLHRVFDMKRVAGRKVLDIGCGVGTMFEQMSVHGAHVTGLDLSPRHASLTQRRREIFHLPGRVFHGDAENLPFADGSFDLIYSWGVLHHTPDTPKTIRETFRVLRPGGEAFLMLYNRDSFHFWWNKVVKWGIFRAKLLTMSMQELANRTSDHVLTGGNPMSQWLRKKDMRRMMTDAGYRDVQVSPTAHGDTVRRGFPASQVPVGLLIPPALAARLMRRWGHLAIITGRKQ